MHKMQSKITMILLLLLLSACAPKLTPQQEDFKKLCESNKHMFMKMTPIKDGFPTGDPACYGCMPDQKNHVCDVEEYKGLIKNS